MPEVPNRKRKSDSSTEDEAKVIRKWSHTRVLSKYLDLANYMLEVDEVRERLFAKGILTSEKSQTIKALLAKNGGINDAAKGLHQMIADDPRRTTFFLFLDILENTRQDYLADEYRKAYLEDVKVELQDQYKANYGTVPRKPWIDDDFTDIDGIFINLELQERPEFRENKDNKPYGTYSAIFNDEHFKTNRKCVVCGVAGSGKSTLSQKIVFDWANGIIHDFYLVFLIPLREVNATEGISQKIKSEYPDHVYNQLLRLKKGSILLILDGIDELSDDVDSIEVQNFLKDPTFQIFSVLMTTRPHGLAIVKPCKPLKLNIKGFSEEDVKKYIKNYFCEEDSEKAIQVITKCAKSNNLWSLIENPLCCLLICFLYEWRYAEKDVDYEMPDKRTELYSEVMEAFEQIYNKKYTDGKWAQTMSLIGMLAFDKLLAKENGVLIFDEKVLAQYNVESTSACKVGVLSRVESFKGRKALASSTACSTASKYNFYNFIHKSIQEFTAASYVHQADETALQNILERLKRFIATPSQLESLDLFLHFLCGLEENLLVRNVSVLAQMFSHCNIILRGTRTMKSRKDVVSILVSLCMESKPDLLIKIPSHVRLEFVRTAADVKYFDVPKNKYIKFARMLGALNTPDIQRSMTQLVTVDAEKLFLNKQIHIPEGEVSAIARFIHPTTFKLSSHNLTSFPASFLMHSEKLETLELANCTFRNLGSFGQFLTGGYKWPNLKVYSIVNPKFPITDEEISGDIDEVQTNDQEILLENLDISKCTKAECFSYLPPLFEHAHRLTTLSLRDDHFGNQILKIASAIPSSVEEIDLGNSELGNSGLDHIVRQLPRLKGLSKLSWNTIRVTKCQNSNDKFSLCITAHTPVVILSEFCEIIKELDVSGLTLDREMFNLLWALPISVEVLQAKGCDIAINFSELFKRWQHIESFDLSEAKLTEEFSPLLHPLPPSLQCIRLHKICMSDNSVISLSKQVHQFQNFDLFTDGFQLNKSHDGKCKIEVSQCSKTTNIFFQNIQVGSLHIVFSDNGEQSICSDHLDSLLRSMPQNICGIDIAPCTAKNDQIVTAVVNHLADWTELQYVSLQGYKLDHLANKMISVIPVLGASLVSLDLGDCTLNDNILNVLMQYLPKFVYLRDLSLAGISLSHIEEKVSETLPQLSSFIQTLNLSDCDLPVKCVTTLLQKLVLCPSLSYLNLAYNSLEHSESQCVRFINSMPSSLTTLNFYKCNLTQKSVDVLLKILPNQIQLTDLDIGNNSLQNIDNSCLALLPISLINLNVSMCSLTKEGVKCLISGLARWTKLRELNLSSNRLSRTEWEELCGFYATIEMKQKEVVVKAWSNDMNSDLERKFGNIKNNIQWKF